MPTWNQIEAAARCMEHLCSHDWHGYTQGGGRWGDGEGTCPVDTPIGTCYVEQGDRDCSSAVVSSYEAAGISCGGATFTGNMYDCMTSTGNFRGHWMSDGYNCDDGYVAKRGDCYLNEGAHTAMCTSAVPDQLAEFCCSETGGIYGNTGDQTGWESVTGRAFYGYPWNWVMEVIPEGDPEPAPAPSPEPAPAPTPDTKNRLNGIDVSSWQTGIDTRNIAGDFVIAKITGGVGYVNPDHARQLDEAVAGGKLIGAYHFARERGCSGSAEAEADYFVDHVQPWLGRCVLILDWEADAVDLGPAWAKRWLDRVTERTGIRPVFYTYNSCVNSWDWSDIAAEYPLWNAGYYMGYDDFWGYYPDAPLYGGTGDWDGAIMYQYTSSGHLDGWGGNLDFNVFYGNRDAWDALAGNKKEDELTPQDKKDIAWEVLWGHHTVDGNDGWTLGGAVLNMVKDTWAYQICDVRAQDRLYGMDCAVNAYLPAILEIVEKVATKEGIDGQKVAKQVAAEVAKKLEKISLDVSVKE